MRASRFLISTLRDNPQDAVVASHRLMLRSGLIRKLGAGLYHMLPLGLRSFRKIETIIRDEMDRSGAIEFVLPILTPAEIWQRSGRWDTMGKEMFRLKDRHEVDNLLGPTHEEPFTELLSGIVQSHRDLPINVYQIHTKFRDEIRPRFGVIRSREFVMKDAYSFHIDDESLDETYQTMRRTYRAIFERVGLKTIPVEADSGTMGGSGSEEFMVPSEIGEETLLLSTGGSYASNSEKTPVLYRQSADVASDSASTAVAATAPERIHTPSVSTIEALAEFLGVERRQTMKSLLYIADGKPVAIFLRGDRELNEVKLKNRLDAIEIAPATPTEIELLGSVVGFIGPAGLSTKIATLYDLSLQGADSLVTGANERDYHLKGYRLRGDEGFFDLALARAGDPSPVGDGELYEMKGIELGHIFKLGRKYTEAFAMSVLDSNGKAVTPTMGCYGIGVNRTLAAVVEQSHDERGIIWPLSVAPFEIVLVSIARGEAEIAKIEAIYNELLSSGFDLLWDDRDLRPGVKFTDAELIGFPIRITIGKGYFEKGVVELQIRATGEKREIAATSSKELIDELQKVRTELLEMGPLQKTPQSDRR